MNTEIVLFNKNYKHTFIEKVISPSLNENYHILNEVFIYEAFLDSIQKFLTNRYTQTMDDLANKLKNSKDAAIVIKDIIQNEEYLESTLTQLNRLIRINLKQLRQLSNELQGANSPVAQNVNFLLNKIIQKSNYFFSMRGWKGFLASLGMYGITRYLVVKIVETRDDVNLIKSFFSTQNVQDFETKIENFVSMITSIASSTMTEFMGFFTSMVDIMNILMEVLSQIKRKLSITPQNITLNNEDIKQSYYKFKNKLNEISKLSFNDDRELYRVNSYDYWKYWLGKSPRKVLGKIDRYTLYFIENVNDLYDYAVLLDNKNKKTVIQVKLMQNDFYDKQFYILGMTKGNKEYSGKKYAVRVYAKLIRSGYNLISDYEQTGGGIKIWIELVNQPGVYVYAIREKDDGSYEYSDVESDGEVFANFNIYDTDRENMITDKIDYIDERMMLISTDIQNLYKNNKDEKASELEKKYNELSDKKIELEKKYHEFKKTNSPDRKTRLVAIRKKIQ